MSEKKKDLAAQSRREDEVLNRTLLWIGGAAILLLFLLFLNRYFLHYRVSEISLAVMLNNYVIPGVTVIALIFCAIGMLLAKKAPNGSTRQKWYAALAIFCGGLTLCAAAAWKFHEAGVQFMCAAVPAVAVLALVYYLFQREFFLIAVAAGISIAALWTIRRAAGHTIILYGALVAALVLLAALALFSRKLQAAGGLWKEKRVLSKNAAYSMIYLTCAVMAVMLLAAAVAGSGIAYYLMFPAVGWLIIMAVYFTVKLM